MYVFNEKRIVSIVSSLKNVNGLEMCSYYVSCYQVSVDLLRNNKCDIL